MERLLTEELLKQIKLINYDRSKTLIEQSEIPATKQISDRLGSYGDFQATPDIMKDPAFIEYNKLSKEEQRKLELQYDNKKWKSRLCTKDASQDRSVFDGEKRVSHEEFCKPFGGTQVYKSGEGQRFLDTTEKDVFGQGFYCGCKFNGEVMINNKIQKVNDYLNRPYSEITYEVSEFLRDKHNLMMMLSIALAVFGGSSILLASLSIVADYVDVGFYIEEGDYFMAGLAIMFSVIPFADIVKLYLQKYPGAKKFTKDTIEKLFEKLKLKKPLSEQDKKIIEIMNNAKMVNKAFWKMISMRLKNVVYKYDVFYLVRFIVFFIEKGMIPVRFALKWGLIIGGVFYSWYKIAEILGIKPKSEVFTQDIKEDDLIESIILTFIRNMSNTGYEWSIQNKSSNLSEVAALQYALSAGGYFKNIKQPTYQVENNMIVFNSAKDIKNVKVYNVAGRLVDEMQNKGFDKFQLNKKIDKGVYVLIITDNKGKSFTSRLQYAGKGYELYSFTNATPTNTIRWGYFDEYTENAVKNYQEKNNLVVDGVVGENTLKKILKDIENNSINNLLTIHKRANYTFTEDDTTQKTITKEDIENAYLQQRQKTLDSLNNVFTNQVDREKQDSLVNVWEQWNFSQIN